MALALGVVLPLVILRENEEALRRRREAALHDSVTELGSAKKMMEDLERGLRTATSSQPLVLMIFDLEGFKKYNDSYGRACGDALLWRLARKLAAAVRQHGEVYRLRGDEYGALVRADGADVEAIGESASAALFEVGEGFMIRASHGIVTLPLETEDPHEALRIADQRVHARRNDPGFSAKRPPMGPAPTRLAPPLYDIAELCEGVAPPHGQPSAALEDVVSAAQLRDVGNMAIPDAILHRSGSVDEHEWRFIRFHTLVGERLLATTFKMHGVGKLVRSSHERWDGCGYPDGLAGDEIPLGSRIIFVCSAFQDMTSVRSHRAALSPEEALRELDLGAGTQFDPGVVEAFCAEFRWQQMGPPISAGVLPAPTY